MTTKNIKIVNDEDDTEDIQVVHKKETKEQVIYSSLYDVQITYSELDEILTSDFPNDKANIIAKALENFIVLFDGDKGDLLYIRNERNIYEPNIYKDDTLFTMVTKIIENTFKNLNDKQKNKVTKIKSYEKVFKNPNVKDYLPQLKTAIKKYSKNIVFDSYFNEIHFNNGYLDLSDLKFKQRQSNKHYISKCIDRDFEEVTEADKKEILKYIEVIFNDKEDLKTVLMTFGSALSGQSTKEQDLMIFYGNGSAGKSFTLELVKLCIQDVYFKELKADTFVLNNPKIDKILNSFAGNPQLRVTWINEPKDKRCDGDLLKTFCDGSLQTTKLFKENSHTVRHNSKAFFTMNSLMNIGLDSGIERRIKAYEPTLKFVDRKEDVNENERVYLKDKDLLLKLANKPNLLNAFVVILAEHCNLWLNKEPIKYSKKFIEAKNTILNVNDQIQDFIDSKLVITKNENDRIGKMDMLRLFKEMYDNKKMDELQLRNALKQKNIKYSDDKRVNNIKGCFLGVQEKLELQNELDELNSIENEKNEEIEALKRKIKELEETVKQLQKPKIELSIVNNVSVEKITQKDSKKPKAKETKQKQYTAVVDSEPESIEEDPTEELFQKRRERANKIVDSLY
jgi:hypothetical protein